MVKLATTVIFTAALAVATVRAQQAGAETVEDVLSRDVSAGESDLFGRAAAKVMNDLFSREELEEVYGREFENDLTWRDVTELVEREAVDMDEVEGLAARAAAPQQPPSDAAGEEAPAPVATMGPHNAPSVAGQVMSFFYNLFHPPKNATTVATPKGQPASAPAPASGDNKPPASGGAASEGASAPEGAPASGGAPAEEGAGAAEARDFADSYFEEPIERSFGEEALDLAEREFSWDSEDLELRELIEEGFALAEREEAEAMEAREFLEDYSDLIEREFDDELVERDLLEEDAMDMFEREFEDDLLEQREFEEDVYEREFEEDVYEREFEDAVYEREVGDEWDDELLRRAYNVLEELEQLD